MDLNEEKAVLLETCKKRVEERVKEAQNELASYNAQSSEETKSSAGDKYETARAMIHLEKEKMSIQLDEAMKLQQVLEMIKSTPDVSGLGRLVVTDQGRFFISVSLGLVKCLEQNYYVLSPVAPLGKLLAQAQVGSKVTFNGKNYAISVIA